MEAMLLRSSIVGASAISSLQARGTCDFVQSHNVSPAAHKSLQVRAAGGTRIIKNLKVVQIGDKTGTVRSKVAEEAPAVKLLSRVQDLKLLSKAEKAGLLTLAENAGLSLGTIEKLGLLSKAEELGILSAASNPSTPSALVTVALLLLVAGPIAVYVIPEDNTVEVVVQILIALISALGGAAAFGGSKVLASLQKS